MLVEVWISSETQQKRCLFQGGAKQITSYICFKDSDNFINKLCFQANYFHLKRSKEYQLELEYKNQQLNMTFTSGEGSVALPTSILDYQYQEDGCKIDYLVNEERFTYSIRRIYG